MSSRSAVRLRAAALATAVAVAFGAAGCGEDDGSSGSDREQARATVERLYDAIVDGDAEKVCEQLNEDAQEQLASGGLGTKSGSCADSFQKFLDEAEKAGGLDLTLKAKVESVKVTGDTGVAKVRFGPAGQTGEIPLEKVDGDWKLEAAGATPTQ